MKEQKDNQKIEKYKMNINLKILGISSLKNKLDEIIVIDDIQAIGSFNVYMHTIKQWIDEEKEISKQYRKTLDTLNNEFETLLKKYSNRILGIDDKGTPLLSKDALKEFKQLNIVQRKDTHKIDREKILDDVETFKDVITWVPTIDDEKVKKVLADNNLKLPMVVVPGKTTVHIQWKEIEKELKRLKK